MQLFDLDRQALIQRLKTSENGLSPDQVGPAARGARSQRTDHRSEEKLSPGLSAPVQQFFRHSAGGGGRSSPLSPTTSRPDEGMNILGYAILGAVIINATFTFWQEYRADKAMEELLKLMPTMVIPCAGKVRLSPPRPPNRAGRHHAAGRGRQGGGRRDPPGGEFALS